jgi:hypothetical protein
MSVIEGTNEKASVLSEVWKPAYDFKTINVE